MILDMIAIVKDAAVANGEESRVLILVMKAERINGLGSLDVRMIHRITTPFYFTFHSGFLKFSTYVITLLNKNGHDKIYPQAKATEF